MNAPVLFQYRMRPVWEADQPWSDWKECSRLSYGDFKKSQLVNDWAYETRELYTKREWVGLTDEEIGACWIGGGWNWEAIEAKLREKNT